MTVVRQEHVRMRHNHKAEWPDSSIRTPPTAAEDAGHQEPSLMDCRDGNAKVILEDGLAASWKIKQILTILPHNNFSYYL